MKKRLFLALPIEREVSSQLEPLLVNLGKENFLHTKKQDLHVTVLFLGFVEEEKIADLAKLTEGIADNTASFQLTLEKVELAPPGQTKTMVWAIFSENESYSQLAEKTSGVLGEFSQRPLREKRIPHITLARFKEKEIKELNLTNFKLSFNLRVQRLVLYESIPNPEGSTYLKLEEFLFNG